VSPACPLCNNRSESAFTGADWNLETSLEEFKYYRCPNCATVFIFPVPADLGKYYPPSYPAYATKSDLSIRNTDPLANQKLEVILKYVSGGRLLEIGPGSGGFLRVARDGGFQVEAVEMDRDCCDFLGNTLGIPTVHSPDIVASLATLPTYDVIVLWHVIEHLPLPGIVLENLSKHLNPAGILVLTAPNPRSLQFRFFGKYWVHLDTPRHLVLIPPSWLTKTANDLNLDTIYFSTRDKLCHPFGNFGWLMASFSNVRKMILKCNLEYLTLPWIFRTLLLIALFKPAENIQGLGSTYTAVFRKRSVVCP
jgi:SAM-dependent methyltransferase